MKLRLIFISKLIILIGFIFGTGMLAVPWDKSATNASNEVKLFDLKKKGSCDSTKYTISNIDVNPIITQHSITNKDGIEVYRFESSLGQGESKTYNLFDMVILPPGFVGDAFVQGTGKITGEILPFPPCGISIDEPPLGSIKINTPYTFTAIISPEDVLLPININWYEWMPNQNDWHVIGIGDSVELMWSEDGWKEICVGAANAVGSITNHLNLHIDGGTEQIYIPITLK